MYITRHTDYALRVLIYLALKDGESATISEIAEHYGISRHHLTKVVNKLNQRDHLVATRGKNGGLHLPRPPAEISVGEVFRDMENELGVVECMNDPSACVLGQACELKNTFKQALAAFLAVVDERSLADLLPPAKLQGMRQVLAMTP